MKAWKCIVCGEIVYSEERPEECPVCGAPADQFIEIESQANTFTKNTDETFVIVGAGAAGVNAAEALRIRNQTARIILLSEENQYAYHRPQLTKNIKADVKKPEFLLKDPVWYRDHEIDVRLGVKALSADATSKSLELDNGIRLRYDKLILCSGASGFIPPITGSNQENVIAIRNNKDTERILSLVPKVSKALVIGGGILGLEAAWQLKLLGLPVTVLEVAPLLMMRQLDEASSLHLRKISEAKGLIIHTGVQISEIKAENNWASSVILQDGRSFEADLIIVSAGVKASVELAKQLGVTLGRAIIVDETMRTSVPDVFAAGDCAEFKGINYAIWPQALDQGKVAGANAAGDELVYQTIVPAVSMHALDTPLYAIGDPGKDPNRTYTTIEKEEGLIASRYFFSDDVLVGGVLFGDIDQSINLMEGIEQRQTKGDFLKSIL